MTILINNRNVVLPSDFQMSYDIENRFFSVKTEGWSLDFDLPLRGCPTNIEIFGAVHHKNIRLNTLSYSCVIRHGTFERQGIAVPISVNESVISLQFLSGRSQLNYVSPLESTIIRDVSLPMTLQISKVACLSNAQHDIDDGRTELCLPWVNDHSGNVQNHIDIDTPVADPDTGLNYYYFDSDTTQVSCQIYLIELTRRILVTVGYSVDFTDWENTVWKYLLVWNAVPAAWGVHYFNIALPRWSVLELLEQIELLTGLDFDINEQDKKITARTASSVVSALGTVVLDKVEEQYEMEVEDNELDFREACELRYADRGDNEWKYESCEAAIQKMVDDGVISDTPVPHNNWSTTSAPYSTFNVTDMDNDITLIDERRRYFKRMLISATQNGSTGQGDPIFLYETGFYWMNMFGDTSTDEKAKFKELNILPARIIHTVTPLTATGCSWDYVAINPGEYEQSEPDTPTTEEEARNYKGVLDKYLDKEQESQEYLNKIYVTFWKKEFAYTNKDDDNQPYCLYQNNSQFGIRDRQQTPAGGERNMYNYMRNNWNNLKFNTNMTLALRAPEHQSLCLQQVYANRKYKFKWISKTVPDVKSLFIVNGRRYYCSVIRTKWTVNGMSEELEGDFYEIR